MTTSENKSYYAIIPANVRYDKDLPPNAKLLYGEITALCNAEGYCWAGNKYFANLYGVSVQSVSKWIALLSEKKYIFSQIIYKEGTKEILNRYITLVEYPIKEKLNTPIKEKFKDNNTSSFNNTNNKSKKERKKSGYDDILSSIQDTSLRELYTEYIKMRKLIKSPMTDRALTMLIDKVNKLEPGNIERQKRLLETAIMNNWKSVYPLKDEVKEKTKSFNTDDFFNAAVKRSALEREVIKRAEEKAPPKTAADDEGIRSRMEALQNKLKE